ncbi:isocyanide synthase family protein [Amycolatopsis marina]|uniref:isocyanide synthase family protein n=1 Tax=Amycolatopsis marina TaxID=490629 RepID=UPI0015A54C2B|nr:isocyanide synthase family protein [Amycolatopsis marina]
MKRSVEAGRPVLFVLPAFPCKSPNEAKVLGNVPDLAEQLALESLDTLIGQIGAVHPPGAELVIASDGRVFGDILGIPDEDITIYRRELQVMIDSLPQRRIRLIALDDFPGFARRSHDQARARLAEAYAEDLDTLRERVRAGIDVALYRAITRFLFEDRNTATYQGSRSALQRTARARAYQMLQRSKAWGDLLVERYPGAVRLSIHPQPCGAPKLGIHLTETRDNWLTPWHSVAVDLGDRFVLMKRAEAEAAGAELVSLGERPSHFTMRQSRSQIA